MQTYIISAIQSIFVGMIVQYRRARKRAANGRGWAAIWNGRHLEWPPAGMAASWNDHWPEWPSEGPTLTQLTPD